MKKYIHQLRTLALAGVLVFAGACSHFEEMNTNPNVASEVPTAYLMTQSQRSLVDLIHNMNTASFHDIGMHYSQTLSAGTYTNFSNYSTTEFSFYAFYTSPLNDLQHIIDLNTSDKTKSKAAQSGANVNQIAVAKILQSWGFMMATDLWGAIPYSEALKGTAAMRPKYDAQKDIYKGILENLKNAVASIDKNGTIQGDIIYKGNMDKWKKFGNALIMRAAMRTADKNDAGFDAKSYFVAAASETFTSNADNAQYYYLTSSDNANPYFKWINELGRRDYYVSDVLVNYMKATNDPRIPVYAQPAVSPVDKNNVYVGMPYGLRQGAVSGAGLDNYSIPGTAFVKIDAPYRIFTLSEVNFLKAEAVARGWTSGDAAALYKSGIEASLTQFGLDASGANAIVEKEPYDAANWKKAIGTQKWVATFMQGIENYSEWRRLDYPQLKASDNAFEGRSVPMRMEYALNENDLNKENLSAGKTLNTGGSNYDNRLWWDAQ